ncbi:hypothetical protein AGMMS49959_07640 [Planctomycetales bacterium]|nr:hypothetical protein AGMMS49959_07640 [Planctomycetales bacterium]
MKVGRSIKAACVAAAVMAGSVFAGDDDLSAMKSQLEAMKAEMAAVKADYAQSQALRGQAGGEPEGLRSANGNATIRIGGDFRVRYTTGWASRNRNNTAPDSNWVRTQGAGWAIEKAALDFAIDLSCDTSAHIVLRTEGGGGVGNGKILDNAYWEWRNVGGVPLTLTVGLTGTPFGMNNNSDVGGYDWGSTDRALISDAFTKASDNDKAAGDLNTLFKGTNTDLTTIGVFAKYALIEDQLFVKGGVFADDSWYSHHDKNNTFENNTFGNNAGFNQRNEIRNIGFINHAISLAYNPCFIEGLHLEAGYQGTFDNAYPLGLGNDGNDIAGRNSYSPSFDLAAAYKVNDKLTLAAEGVVTWNPGTPLDDIAPLYDGIQPVNGGYRDNSYAYSLSFTGDYSVTEKLKLGLGFDVANAKLYGAGANGDLFSQLYRASAGARYAFGNGLYVQAQYYHEWAPYTVTGNGGNEYTRNADVILLRTGYTF